MHQSMYHSTLGVEFGYDFVKQPSVSTFVSTENGVGDEVRKLQQPRCFRVCKERDIRKVLHRAPVSGPETSILSKEGLKAGFIPALIKNDESTLRVALGMQTAHKQITTVADFVKSARYPIIGKRLFECYSEQGDTTR